MVQGFLVFRVENFPGFLSIGLFAVWGSIGVCRFNRDWQLLPLQSTDGARSPQLFQKKKQMYVYSAIFRIQLSHFESLTRSKAQWQTSVHFRMIKTTF